eukprot:8927859-Lingulodinium_polyedra.AAC.1
MFRERKLRRLPPAMPATGEKLAYLHWVRQNMFALWSEVAHSPASAYFVYSMQRGPSAGLGQQAH